MKRYFLTLLILSSLNTVSWSQGDPDSRPEGRERMLEKMESMRVAFLTNKLDLTSEESARFWPVYNEYSRKRMELRKDMVLHKRRHREMSEKESKQELDEQFEIQEKELSLKKNYYEKFKEILPYQKLAQLEPAEMEFNHEVVRKLKERRENRMGGKGMNRK